MKKQNYDSLTVTPIDKRQNGDAEYALYSVELCGKCRYLLSARLHHQAELELLGGRREDALEFFSSLCENQVSCEHLSNVADDYRYLLMTEQKYVKY